MHKNTSETLHRIIDVNKQPTIEYMLIYRVYDEYLMFKDFDENVYDVQIEHSENYDEHKYNIVEFVVRNLVDKDMDMSNVILTKLLSYKINKATGKLIYKLETGEKQVPMSKRTLYKSFGKYKTLIEDEMIAETKVDNS